VPSLGLAAGLPERQGEMFGSDPRWTQQSHHVQAQRQKDAQQSDQLEGSEHVHLVHGHLLITRYKAAGQSLSGELAEGPTTSSPTITLNALCVCARARVCSAGRVEWETSGWVCFSE